MGSLPHYSQHTLTKYTATSKATAIEQPRQILSDSTNRQLNHSPIESPPTVKKKLCRLAKGLLEGQSHQGALEGLDAAFVFEAPAVDIAELALGGVPRSLQNRPRLERSSSFSNSRGSSILKKQKNQRGSVRARSATSWPPARNVKFQDNVTVFRIDDDGEYVCTECQKLQGDPHTQQVELYRGPSPGHNGQYGQRVVSAHPHVTPDPTAHLYRAPEPPQTRLPHTTTLVPAAAAKPQITNILQDNNNNRNSSTSSLDLTSNVNFTFVEDQMHGLKIRFAVPLGLGYGPNDIVVKANMSGSRIRVLATKTSPDGAVVESFNERYPLPMDVDPYMVTARLDIKGQLIVEAPLMTLARRQSLSKGRQNNS